MDVNKQFFFSCDFYSRPTMSLNFPLEIFNYHRPFISKHNKKSETHLIGKIFLSNCLGTYRGIRLPSLYSCLHFYMDWSYTR